MKYFKVFFCLSNLIIKAVEYAAIYKGEVIAQGTAKQVRESLDELWTARGAKLKQGIEEIFKNGGVPFLKGFSREKILAIAKHERPDPFEYLKKEYILQHLKKFEDEGIASRIVLKDDYDRFGVGKPDLGKTEFVSTKSEIDKILKLPLNEQSRKLGISIQQLNNGQVMRIDFKLSSKNKIFMPSGNEFGTNSKWLPGGMLPEKNLEAIIKTEGMKEGIDYIAKIIR
ncbi:hypothetical protein J2X31_003205 [Flavobacterium arsenatis]|uniref:Uncharacterized protein n=1 Tax=Flavobacterium arsenatis TaxID=1484332 RepID=A0ABU1TTG9_9FLAO|nr:hypothetical protein [Flavobacterium arsenatis]MDR6969178.1 hypothetical protein [Flavobacterium arsenatis]